ncbi:hypothetical protein INR49_007374 [Caranx melampygus]|nr:hypothetical protein INR49_007374 [Caranx melampygus]
MQTLPASLPSLLPPLSGSVYKNPQRNGRTLSTSVGQSDGQTDGHRRHPCSLLYQHNTDYRKKPVFSCLLLLFQSVSVEQCPQSWSVPF